MEDPSIHLSKYLYEHQKIAIQKQNNIKKCLINMWCGTGKTRTFTINIFIQGKKMNIIVFPSLGLINQYCNNYYLSSEEPFKTEFKKYKCLAFCSDNDGKLKSKGSIKFTTKDSILNNFLRQQNNLIILVTYQSFEKFINICIEENININNLIYDEAHHIVGDKIQDVVFKNVKLDNIVDKTRFYTATPVNKNGINMYDRENPENSDCGELAYEYLYYQAVEDFICKPFETLINLYTQKPEYKNKYQPVFESIIRTCLSGKPKFWNILTYHSFVNEADDMNNNISFVKDFASPKNEKLFKQLFTKIQNNEFHDTKKIYSVENVILKGVHSKTPTRQHIITEFDKKVEGRIFVLASCGILNEGIDTKWANMGVPINPSKSIVKESQRIGRLVRIPEENMPPAVVLIPCEVDITKYSSINTREQQDQMIREELCECGNFNTALNVISAFKYQFDPDLFEMCLKYPNMYAPKEIKDNLGRQGLIVEESQGEFIDNLKYICEKERIELDIEAFKDESKEHILSQIATQYDKTIEIHTQNYDEPIKYYNEDSTNEIPLRLFHCEDDDTYAPITMKNKKQKIKKNSTKPPKKRSKLFDIHTHPDLEVLWKIKENSIDLNKTFSQGILDVDINWNEKKWFEKLDELKEFIDINKSTPNSNSKNKEEKYLGAWLGTQKHRYKNKKNSVKNPEIFKIWEEFIKDSQYSQYFISDEEKWFEKFNEVKQFIHINKSIPNTKSKNNKEKKLHKWLDHQKQNYKNKKYIMKNPKICKVWEEFIKDPQYSEYFQSKEEIWFNNFNKLKQFIDINKSTPNSNSKNKEEKYLGTWLGHQKKNYKIKKESMNNPKQRKIWEDFIKDPQYSPYLNAASKKKNMSKPAIKSNIQNKENKKERQQRVQSELSTLHQKYKTLNSQNLNTYFKKNPEMWKEYHTISKTNEESFPEEEIPRNKMIEYLKALPGKRKKFIADLGCGFAEINQYFKDNPRFDFHNFDHHSSSELVVSKDIKNTELDDYSIDIVILSLAMWGRNYIDYLKESYRILDTGGTLLIAEPYKRWNKELNKEGNPINKLVKVLEKNNFTIKKCIEEKFMFIECTKL